MPFSQIRPRKFVCVDADYSHLIPERAFQVGFRSSKFFQLCRTDRELFCHTSDCGINFLPKSPDVH